MSNITHAVHQWAKKQAKTAGTLGAGIIIGTAGSAVVLAVIPDNNGVIHGCYRNNGALRIIDSASQTCNNNEAALTWNQTGPQGPVGPQGPAGGGGLGAFLDDLSGVHFTQSPNLQYRNFAGVDFHDAFFENAIFSGSDLSGADFTNARLDSGDWVGVKATDINFTSAELNGGIAVNNTNFQGSNFSGAYINHFSGENADLRNTNFSNVTIGSGFGALNFTDVDLSTVTFTNVGTGSVLSFDDTNMQGVNLSGRTFGYTSFNGVNFNNANLSGTIFDAASPGLGAYFANNTTTSGTNFTNAEFNYTNFTGTDLSNATLSGVTWNNVTCPDGTNSNSNGNTCVGHLVP